MTCCLLTNKTTDGKCITQNCPFLSWIVLLMETVVFPQIHGEATIFCKSATTDEPFRILIFTPTIIITFRYYSNPRSRWHMMLLHPFISSFFCLNPAITIELICFFSDLKTKIIAVRFFVTNIPSIQGEIYLY